MSNALDGIRILDLTRLLPGAIATMMLADMGADVIKVEDPVTGDYARWMPPLVNGQGAFFQASNRNKRSIIINLKEADGQALLHRLVEQADVLIEGFRPNVTQRLKIDYATLKNINPRLIYASLSGWGQTGAYAEVSGHDLNYVSLAGLQGAMRSPQALGGQIADVGGAYVGIMGILAALFKRERTGQGDYLDVALFEAALPFALYQIVESQATGARGGAGTLTGAMAFYDVYQSSDNEPLAFAPIEPKFWQNFCQAVGHPEWQADYENPAKQAELKALISALFASKTAAEWDALLRHADCCFCLITPPEQVLLDSHVQARGMAGIGADGLPWMRSPVRMAGETISIGTFPHYGEHTEAVLAEFGYSETEIAALKQAKIVRGLAGKEQVS